MRIDFAAAISARRYAEIRGYIAKNSLDCDRAALAMPLLETTVTLA